MAALRWTLVAVALAVGVYLIGLAGLVLGLFTGPAVAVVASLLAVTGSVPVVVALSVVAHHFRREGL